MPIEWIKKAGAEQTVIEGHRIVIAYYSTDVRLEIWDPTEEVSAIYVIPTNSFDKNSAKQLIEGIRSIQYLLVRQLKDKKKELPQAKLSVAKVTITDPPSRHLRRVLFSVDALVQFLSMPEPQRVVANGLPYGTRVVTVNHDYTRQIFDVLVEHPNFSVTEPGEVIPVLPAIQFEIVKADAD